VRGLSGNWLSYRDIYGILGKLYYQEIEGE